MRVTSIGLIYWARLNTHGIQDVHIENCIEATLVKVVKYCSLNLSLLCKEYWSQVVIFSIPQNLQIDAVSYQG